MQSKVNIIQQAVAKCSKIKIHCKGIEITTLLDSCSELMLLYQSYLDKHLKPVVCPSSKSKGETNPLFRLTAANDGQLAISMYIKLDINFLRLKIPDVGFFIIKDPNHTLDKEHQLESGKAGF